MFVRTCRINNTLGLVLAAQLANHTTVYCCFYFIFTFIPPVNIFLTSNGNCILDNGGYRWVGWGMEGGGVGGGLVLS